MNWASRRVHSYGLQSDNRRIDNGDISKGFQQTVNPNRSFRVYYTNCPRLYSCHPQCQSFTKHLCNFCSPLSIFFILLCNPRLSMALWRLFILTLFQLSNYLFFSAYLSYKKTCFSTGRVKYFIETFQALGVARGHSSYKLTKSVSFYSSVRKSSCQVL